MSKIKQIESIFENGNKLTLEQEEMEINPGQIINVWRLFFAEPANGSVDNGCFPIAIYQPEHFSVDNFGIALSAFNKRLISKEPRLASGYGQAISDIANPKKETAYTLGSLLRHKLNTIKH